MNKETNPATELRPDLAAAIRADAQARAERSEVFWARQRTDIRERIRRQAPQRHTLRIALAGALVLFLVVLLTAPAGPPERTTAQASPVADADQELLIAVERALASGTPQSLTPVSPFVDSNSDGTQTIPHKEHRNED